MPTFEVRIPTYKRPAMLRRALSSLQEQTETDWVAFVFDDSPAHEGETVVRSMQDNRIHYRCNQTNLGAARNIDQVFRKQPLSDARFFRILSDDNFLLANFLQRGRDIVERTGCKIVMINELIVGEDGRPQRKGATTRGDWFSPGFIPLRTLYASLFLFEGVSDGGLFWTRDSKTDLEVDRNMSEVCLQEACRTLKVIEPLYFEPEPCAAFSLLPPEKVVRQTAGNRLVARGRAAIMRYLLRRGGRPMADEVIAFAQGVGKRVELRRNWESALRPWEAPGIGWPNFHWRMRALIRDAITSNPVADFLASQPGLFDKELS